MTQIHTSSFYQILVVALIAVLPLGCGDGDAPQDPVGGGDPAPAVDNSSTPAPPPPVTPVDTVLAPAAPGMGVDAQDLGVGPIVTPINALFRTKERIILMQIQYNMKIYRAMHEKYPATFEEFEEHILKPSQLTLPRLPRGHEYFYDAERGELMVKQPR